MAKDKNNKNITNILRKRRKNSYIKDEIKRRSANKVLKLNFKNKRRALNKSNNLQAIQINLTEYMSSVGKMAKKNIIHKNKLSRLFSKGHMLLNKIKNQAGIK